MLPGGKKIFNDQHSRRIRRMVYYRRPAFFLSTSIIYNPTDPTGPLKTHLKFSPWSYIGFNHFRFGQFSLLGSDGVSGAFQTVSPKNPRTSPR